MKHIFVFLDDELNEYFQERAAIIEHCGGYPKERAEAVAKAETETYRLHREKIDADKVQK
jgi:hypothetical protein